MLRVLKDSELAQPIAQYCSRPVVHAAQPVPSMPREQAIPVSYTHLTLPTTSRV